MRLRQSGRERHALAITRPLAPFSSSFLSFLLLLPLLSLLLPLPLSSSLAIYDTMQYIKPPISTVCMGQAASMGSLLLAGGSPGMRYALPNARLMVHQPSGGAHGMASDIQIAAEEVR